MCPRPWGLVPPGAHGPHPSGREEWGLPRGDGGRGGAGRDVLDSLMSALGDLPAQHCLMCGAEGTKHSARGK